MNKATTQKKLKLDVDVKDYPAVFCIKEAPDDDDGVTNDRQNTQRPDAGSKEDVGHEISTRGECVRLGEALLGCMSHTAEPIFICVPKYT